MEIRRANADAGVDVTRQRGRSPEPTTIRGSAVVAGGNILGADEARGADDGRPAMPLPFATAGRRLLAPWKAAGRVPRRRVEAKRLSLKTCSLPSTKGIQRSQLGLKKV